MIEAVLDSPPSIRNVDKAGNTPPADSELEESENSNILQAEPQRSNRFSWGMLNNP